MRLQGHRAQGLARSSLAVRRCLIRRDAASRLTRRSSGHSVQRHSDVGLAVAAGFSTHAARIQDVPWMQHVGCHFPVRMAGAAMPCGVLQASGFSATLAAGFRRAHRTKAATELGPPTIVLWLPTVTVVLNSIFSTYVEQHICTRFRQEGGGHKATEQDAKMTGSAQEPATERPLLPLPEFQGCAAASAPCRGAGWSGRRR
jgi:hypothetical protein